VGDNYHILDDDRPQSGNFKPANRVCYKHEAVTVSNVHRKGARESSAAIDPPMKGLDPGFILVGSVKDGHGRLGGLSVFYLQELKRAIRSGGRIQREVAIGLGAQWWGVAEEGQHGAHAGQTPGATATFHAVDDELVDIAFNGSQGSRERAGAVFRVPHRPSRLLRT
jgi:hypothetical protein